MADAAAHIETDVFWESVDGFRETAMQHVQGMAGCSVVHVVKKKCAVRNRRVSCLD